MEIEVVYGQVVAKANHYLTVPGRNGRRIIKDDRIRAYERSFVEQCRVYRNRHISSRFRLFVRVFHSSPRYDLDNALKTLLDCLELSGAIVNDRLCIEIQAEKHIDKNHPRIEFCIEEVNKQKQINFV